MMINTIGFTADMFSAIQYIWTANSGIEIYHDKIGSTRKDINTQNGALLTIKEVYTLMIPNMEITLCIHCIIFIYKDG